MKNKQAIKKSGNTRQEMETKWKNTFITIILAGNINAGMSTIMGGPNVVRGGSHSGNDSAADLSDKGLLGALSSDYVPSSLLYGAFLLNDKQGLSLPDAIATVTTNPARMANFNDRGEIKAGLRADLIQVKRCTDGTPIVRKTFKLGERVA